VVEWWRRRFPTRFQDEDHTLTVHGQEEDAELYLESTPVRVRELLVAARRDSKGNDTATLNDIDAKLEEFSQLRGERDPNAQPSADSSSDPKMGRRRGERIAALMGEIAALLKKIGVLRPVSHVEWDPSRMIPPVKPNVGMSEVGARMVAEPLSINPPTESAPDGGPIAGSQPLGSATTTLWDAVRQRQGAYVRGHLLNHHVYGPGRNFNLVPITGILNGDMSRLCEENVKKAILEDNKVVSYEVTIHWRNSSRPRTIIPEENDLPSAVTLQAKEMTKKPGAAKGANADDWVANGRSIFAARLPHTLPPE
jgi:hypothetical protein